MSRGPVYTCPYARTENGTMLVLCVLSADGKYCGHSYWRRCRGWAENTADAAQCPVRKEAEDSGQSNRSGA